MKCLWFPPRHCVLSLHKSSLSCKQFQQKNVENLKPCWNSKKVCLKSVLWTWRFTLFENQQWKSFCSNRRELFIRTSNFLNLRKLALLINLTISNLNFNQLPLTVLYWFVTNKNVKSIGPVIAEKNAKYLLSSLRKLMFHK